MPTGFAAHEFWADSRNGSGRRRVQRDGQDVVWADSLVGGYDDERGYRGRSIDRADRGGRVRSAADESEWQHRHREVRAGSSPPRRRGFSDVSGAWGGGGVG